MADNDKRALVPVMIATAVLAIGVFFMWSDLRNDAPDRGNDIITSTVVSRAGATLIPSAPPSDMIAPRTVPVSEPTTVGRVTR